MLSQTRKGGRPIVTLGRYVIDLQHNSLVARVDLSRMGNQSRLPPKKKKSQVRTAPSTPKTGIRVGLESRRRRQ